MTAPRASVQVVGAQVIAQVSLVAVLPFLTRTYSTTDIGYFQLAMAVAMTAQPLATLRSEFAVPSLVTDSAVRRLVRTGLLVLSIVVLVGCCLSALLARSHAGPAQVALMAALMLAGLGWTAIDNAVLIRSGDTGRLAVRNLLGGLIAAVAQLTTAFAGGAVVFLAASVLVGRVVAIAVTRRSLPEPGTRLDTEPHPYTVPRAVSSMLSGLVASATGQSLIFATGLGQSATASAYVGVAQRAAGAPLTLLGQGLAQLMQSHVAPLVRAGKPGVRARILKQVLVLSVVAVACSAALIILAPPLAVPLLGPGWEDAGLVVAILAIPMSFQLVIGPLMTVLPLLGRERLLLATQVSRFLLVALTLVVALANGAGLVLMTVCYGVATVLGYLGMLAVVLGAAGNRDAQMSQHDERLRSTT